jgi:hypothetical protein
VATVADAVCQKGRFRHRRNLRQLLQDLQCLRDGQCIQDKWCLQDGQCIQETNGARWLSVIRDLQAIVIWPDLPFS